ncbi:tetratricopeptide repeat protein [Phenylobacterium hankyongense]|nr:tetratricopeptide repeat protein [Phenylobacterium hankyongense]
MPVSAVDLHAAGSAHALRGEWAEAETFFRRALAAEPGDAVVRHALAVSLLGQGRYREGFPLYAHRTEVPALRVAKPNAPWPQWKGEDLKGRGVVLFPEQGLGDQIMLARFAPVLRERGADVTLLCSPALERLFSSSLGVRVIAASGAVEFPDPDFWALIGDLPGLLEIDVEDLKAEPYLRAPAISSGGIGLARRGNPRHANDANRSLPLELVIPFDTVSLSPEDTGAADFLDTAEIVAGLDCVISVDTSVAHLAGALGKPCFVMLPSVGADWRWMTGQQHTPWYPSMSLFRQGRGENWSNVLARLANCLPPHK